jgi:hypothetical protein
MNTLLFPKKDGEPCSECGGSGWTRYFSEMITGGMEEAFRLCERCKQRLPCEAGSASNRQPLSRVAEQEDTWLSIVLFAVLKTSPVEQRALEEVLEKREHALLPLTVVATRRMPR